MDFSSDNFPGVYEICYNNYLGNSDFVLELGHLKVESGNFKMVVLLHTIAQDAGLPTGRLCFLKRLTYKNGCSIIKVS